MPVATTIMMFADGMKTDETTVEHPGLIAEDSREHCCMPLYAAEAMRKANCPADTSVVSLNLD